MVWKAVSLSLFLLLLLLVRGRRRDHREREAARRRGGPLGSEDSDSEWFAPDGLNLVVHLNSRNKKSDLSSDDALKLISFCLDCPSPEEEGSVATGLLPMYFRMRQDEYVVTAQLVYSVPNHADTSKQLTLVNAVQIQGRVVLVDRGKNALHEKVLRLQEAGALGVIIADDGQCDELFRYCGVRAGSALEGGFAAHDGADVWQKLVLPTYLVTRATADRIKSMMRLQVTEVLGHGLQNITVLKPSIGPRDEFVWDL